MTLHEAFLDLVSSQEFKDAAKNKDTIGGRYRQYLSRFNKGELKSGAIVELLLSHGYIVTAKKVVKKQSSEKKL